jgi:uridine kinase
MDPIKEFSKLILQRFYDHTPDHVFTVAISGIDASGKGFVAKHLETELIAKGLRVANINIDPWQNPIAIRLKKENAAENFYQNVFRWDDVFEQLIIPLRRTGTTQFATRLIFSHVDEYFDFAYDFRNIDILLVDAIFLFQQKFLKHYDLNVWIDCSFETGLKRALKRNAERLGKQKLREDYQTYYYPAQRYHFAKDKPKQFSNMIYCNDKLLGTVGQVTVIS